MSNSSFRLLWIVHLVNDRAHEFIVHIVGERFEIVVTQMRFIGKVGLLT